MSLKQHFDLACWWYQVSAEERATMRELARADPDSARTCYAELAREIDLAIRVNDPPLTTCQQPVYPSAHCG